jgi:hypothetical protein
MDKDAWRDQAACKGMETNDFFDNYEDNTEVRLEVDPICGSCPVARQCFAVGVSNKAWGVWGGVYMENGKISREYGKHRTKAQWAEKWQQLTMDKE